uniref:Replication protein E1 n=1 Tax=Human papillomavirus TaxID=10566 RepID=H2BQC3_9PAPI|nr:E1 protein [Human papillomavirus]
MADPKGTKNVENVDDSAWFIVHEADCVDDIDTLDDLFEQSTVESTISNLIDDDVDIEEQGNSLALYNSQVTDECDKAITLLKRKYMKSPQGSVAELSPKLDAVTISPSKERQSKRRLFHDSGLGEDEAAITFEQVESNIAVSQEGKDGGNSADSTPSVTSVLQTNYTRSQLLYKFQEIFGVPYLELTRNFKSQKSCNDNWIVAVFYAATEVLESSKMLLQPHCDCFQTILSDFCGVYNITFKHSKNRETVFKLFNNLLQVKDCQLLAEPPKNKSVPAALFFYKKSLTNSSYVYESLPKWVSQQTLFNHQAASVPEAFQLVKMVQWAYDNKMYEEPEIAYGYALLAEEDSNAQAFLNSNLQVKYVRDCSIMVKHYIRQEMREMNMSQWIQKCCDECEGESDWKVIAEYLKYQQVNVIAFLTALRTLFKRIPKKNCLLIHGPPDTGKSYFTFSLTKFLKGKVISFVNRTSQFWLSPLMDCKIGLLDDATYTCWSYIDQNMRNALDGNVMCIDSKHRQPQQLKLPPLIVTSNIDVLKEETLRYLHSRVMSFEFGHKMPLNDNNEPVYQFTDKVWKCFFVKLAKQLDIEEESTYGSSRIQRTFRSTAGSPDQPL